MFAQQTCRAVGIDFSLETQERRIQESATGSALYSNWNDAVEVIK